MDFLIRYRNLTVLLVVVVAQLLLLAYQVKTSKDVPLLRVWAVSTVTPVEQGLEWLRRHTIGVVSDYFGLVHVKEQNDKLQHELGRLKLENNFLKNQVSTADRAKELAVFQDRTPSKTVAARVIGNGTGANSKVVFVDRGTSSGVENGMAVITPDGIVGKVVAAYPISSLVMLITDPTFAAGVVSQKHRVHGTLKGQGNDPKCKIAYVQNEEPVEAGEWFYTSGVDGIFPRGFPVGQVASVSDGRGTKNIFVSPSGLQGGLDEVLVVTEGAHQTVPEQHVAAAPVKILPPPSDETNSGKPQNSITPLTTDADRLRQTYKQIGEQQKIEFGTGMKPPDFSKVPDIGLPRVAQPQPPKQPETGSQGVRESGSQGAKPPGSQAAGSQPGGGAKPSAPSQPVAQQPQSITNRPVAKVPAPVDTAAPPPKPKPRGPVLETDPTDADPATEAVAERVQRQHKATPPPNPGDRTTEILQPAAPPKSVAPKTVPVTPKTVSPKSTGTQPVPVRKATSTPTGPPHP
jgi:rod shape-determining protein MreC